MRFPAVFLLVTTLSASAFAQTGLRSDVKKDQAVYPPSEATSVGNPSTSNAIIPQSAPVVPAMLGPQTNPVTSVPAGQPAHVSQPVVANPPPAVPVTGAGTNATPVTPTTTTKAPLPSTDGEEIGYDPKVKRDPYGKPIGGASAAAALPKTESDKLRGDTKTSLRSDVKKAPPAAPAAAPARTTLPATR